VGNPNNRSALVGLFLLWKEAQGQPPHLQREIWQEAECLLKGLDIASRAHFVVFITREWNDKRPVFHGVEAICSVNWLRISTKEYQDAQDGKQQFCPQCGAAYIPAMEGATKAIAGGREG